MNEEKTFVFRKKYPVMSKNTGCEFFIGHQEDKRGNLNGRGFMRVFDYAQMKQSRDSQIVVMFDPAELLQISRAIQYVLTECKKPEKKDGVKVPACYPHKYNDTTTTVYVDARMVVEGSQKPKFYCGISVTRENGSNKRSVNVPVPQWKLEYVALLLHNWSTEAAFVEQPVYVRDHDAPTGPDNGSGGDLPSYGQDDAGIPGSPEFDDIPF